MRTFVQIPLDTFTEMKDTLRRYAEHDLAYEAEKRVTFVNVFNYDLSAAPSGQLQLLTAGMTRRVGEVTSVAAAKEQGVIAWALGADRVRAEEVKLGHISQPRNTT